MYTVPCMIFRGGTSKGLFFLEEDLPKDIKQRNDMLLRVMGSPDTRQIDGLGGATSVTSKVAIVAPSTHPEADVDYTFAQVSVDKALVSYAGNCGNISSAIGAFAIEAGLIARTEGKTTVRIYNTNTKKILVSVVQTPHGLITYEGDYQIAGVPGKAAPVKLIMKHPNGTISGKALPTGNVIDVLEIPRFGRLEVSMVDVTNPLVFIRAADVGLKGTELPMDIDSDPGLLSLLETIRGMAAQKLGLVSHYQTSAWDSPGVPKITLVAPAGDYRIVSGETIAKTEIDLVARMMSMQKAHPTYAMTGSLCTAAAAFIPGTLVHEMCKKQGDQKQVRIGHPCGVITAEAEVYTDANGEIVIDSVSGFRTCRLLAKAKAYYTSDTEHGEDSAETR